MNQIVKQGTVIFLISGSESDQPDDTEIVDYTGISAENLCTSDWQIESCHEFIANSSININSSKPVKEELDF